MAADVEDLEDELDMNTVEKTAEEVKKDQVQGKTILKKFPKVLNFLNAILNNKLWTIFMTILTIYALFGDDIRLLACPKSLDEFFYIATSISLFFFFIELVLGSLA